MKTLELRTQLVGGRAHKLADSSIRAQAIRQRNGIAASPGEGSALRRWLARGFGRIAWPGLGLDGGGWLATMPDSAES
jgi:hypothetical protein